MGCKKEVTGITLNKTNITLHIGETESLTATVVPTNATNKTVSWTSNNPVVATVTDGVVSAQGSGTTTITVNTEAGNYTAECVVTVISIDLEGVIINGIRWATRNVDMPGTFAAKPEDAGMFYQWNRKVGWSVTDPMINSDGDTMWDNSEAVGDIWEEANDPCPPGWRVPTLTELEILKNSGSKWATLNGVNGRIFGSEDNPLFLSATGYRAGSNGDVYAIGILGWYWSGTTTGIYAYSLPFDSTTVYLPNSSGSNRTSGHLVRCVAE